MNENLDFPKLPDQDEFLLYLQNNNYSMQTVYNYARDLSILATFLQMRDIKFEDLAKQDLVIYKGYLRSGEHLKDLTKIRAEVVAEKSGFVENSEKSGVDAKVGSKNPDATGEDGGRVSKGSRADEKSSEVSEHLLDGSEKTDDKSKGLDAQFLDNVYKKVFGSFNQRTLKRSKNNQDSDGLDANSINRMLSAFRSYLRYRIDMDLDYPIAPEAVKLMKTEKKKSQVPELDEIIKLMEFPTEFEKDDRVALRNRAMLEMLFSTGMRISELMGLNLDKINLDGKLFIMGKGKKERFVYLTPRAMKWLNKYLQVRLSVEIGDFIGMKGKHGGDSSAEFLGDMSQSVDSAESGSNDGDLGSENPTNRETLAESDNVSQGVSGNKGLEDLNLSLSEDSKFKFVVLLEDLRKVGYLKKFRSPALFIPFSGGRNGKRNKRLSTNFFQSKIAEYRRRLGINVPVSAHSLRHGFATYLAENNASPAAIQVLLGHESLQTTTRYVHASDRMAEKAHKDRHPLK